MATVDFTLEDLKGIFTTKDDLSDVTAELAEVKDQVEEVSSDVKRIAAMLEEDARAESDRLDRVERRTMRTQKLLLEHIEDKDLHRHDG